MRQERKRLRRWIGTALVGAALLLGTGCDPTVRATVEDGVINVSQSFYGAFLRAFLQTAIEANDPNAT